MVDLKQQRNRDRVCAYLETSKLINSSARYQNSSDMRFLRADRLYFDNDFFLLNGGAVYSYRKQE